MPCQDAEMLARPLRDEDSAGPEIYVLSLHDALPIYVVHNLGEIDWKAPDAAFDWNRRFDGDVKEIMTTDPARLPSVQKHPDYTRSVPTDEHFIPLLYLAGLAVAANRPAEVLVEGVSMGSLSMTSYTLGCAAQPDDSNTRGASPIIGVPGDQSNT